MYTEKPLIYHLIIIHNRKFNVNKLFLSKEFRKRDEWFIKKVFAPFFLISTTLTTVLLFFLRDEYYNKFGFICLGIILLTIFSYRYIYFNRKAKRDTGYKTKGNKILGFFKWWLTKKTAK